MSLLRISLFGRFDVQCGQLPLTGFDTRKVQELFCFLLLCRDRPHPREALADLLWDCSHVDRPNRCLRKAIWQLRAALDSQNEPLSEHVLLVEPDWVQLNPEAALWLDVAIFEQAYQRLQLLPGNELDAQGVRILSDAVSLYRGGLQESWYQDWYLHERERFQYMYLIMLDTLMAYCETHHRYAAGLDFGTLILSCEPARERTHRRLMRLHYMAGDRTAALRQYAYCVAALEEELGVGPARRTVTLYEQMRTDQPHSNSLEPKRAHQATRPTSSLLLRMLLRMNQLRSLMGQVQQEIDQDIHTLKLAIDD